MKKQGVRKEYPLNHCFNFF